jgi:hypothetical protein
MRLRVIACNVLFRELSYTAAYSPHTIDAVYLDRRFHENPDDIRREVQAAIDLAEEERYDYDAIVLGYGLCSNGLAGIQARKTPLIIPRAHDCITLLLGSHRRYMQFAQEAPGTYYYTPGWCEREGARKERTSVQGEAARAVIHQEYVEKYGAENAEYLMETLHTWYKNYTRAVYIQMGLVRFPETEEQARKVASDYGWAYEETDGDMRLLRSLTGGDWPEQEFLLVPPGYRTEGAYDDNVLRAVPGNGEETPVVERQAPAAIPGISP